jgi:pseudouridine kinase
MEVAVDRITEREQEILKILKKDPMIAQEELAEKLGISRSAAAVHISNLIKKGFILGRGYVFNESAGVAVIGPLYREVTVQSTAEISAAGFEIALVTDESGGMAGKMCLRLGKLKTATTCFTVVGHDQEGEFLRAGLKSNGVDIHYIATTKDLPTSRLVRIKDVQGVTRQRVGDMRTVELLTDELLRGREAVFMKAKMLVLDTLTPPAGQKYILDLAKNSKKPVCVYHQAGEPVWISYPGILSLLGIDHFQAELITGAAVRDPDDARNVARRLVQRGIRAVLINFPEHGVAFATAEEADIIPAIPGSGQMDFDDYTLMAGVLHGIINGYGLRQAVRFGISAGMIEGSNDRVGIQY